MKPVLIFQHIASNRPGYFAEYLTREGIPWRVVHIDRGELPPDDLDAASGLCLLGGTMSVNDPLPWIDTECRLIREALARELPVIGHCLGGQLISKALGGTVAPHPVAEIGWHPLRRRPGPSSEAWLGDFDDPLIAMQWHNESFSLPDQAEHLLESEHCTNQVFVVGTALGMQCHVEVTADIVREWLSRYGDELVGGPSVHTPEAIAQGIEEHLPKAQRLAERLYARWVAGLE